MRVAICVATYMRPAMLRGLLESLGRLTFAKQPDVEPRIVVVDNDAAASAVNVVNEMRQKIPWPVEYDVEPERNISRARNRAVGLALRSGAEFIAFIDDDEIAHPAWLDELLVVQGRYSADVVNGPVQPRYSMGVPRWVVDGKFFEPERLTTGHPIGMAATNNVLISSSLFRNLACPFDPAFGLSGGGDALFFLRIRQQGARMIWADEAVVEETIPESRASARWLLRRAFRLGNGGVFCERAAPPTRAWMIVRSTKAIARLGYGLLLLAPALLRGRIPTVVVFQKICHSLGALAGIAGIRYYEYRVVHGT